MEIRGDFPYRQRGVQTERTAGKIETSQSNRHTQLERELRDGLKDAQSEKKVCHSNVSVVTTYIMDGILLRMLD
jgi:hypothetical protein